MSGLHKFLICVLSVVVAVSLGVTVYYFTHTAGSTIELSKTVCYENVNETFDITIEQKKKDRTDQPTLVSSDSEIVELINTEGNKFTFKAKKAGEAVVNLKTSSEKDQNKSCKVYVRDGTEAFPYYVRNADDLLSINTKGIDKNYEQIANIDLAGKVFAPIAPASDQAFTGKYNGGNYIISNATLSGNCDYAGLFGFIGQTGKVSNVVMSSFEFKTYSLLIGGIAAVNNGTITACAVEKANLENTNASGYVGGVVAENRTSAKVLMSSFSGNIKNGLMLGGVVAKNINARVSDCYARGSFYPSATSQMGGVVCYNHADTNYRANVINTYSTMYNSAPSNANVGMILFNNRNQDGSSGLSNAESNSNRVYGNHYATTQNYVGVNGAEDIIECTAKILANRSAPATYSTFTENGSATIWDFNSIWNVSQSINDGYPTLRANANNVEESAVYIPTTVTPDPEIIIVDSSVITTPTQLTSLMNETDGYSLSKSYELGANIDMAGVNWIAKPLNGSIDGKGYTISNLTITNTATTGTVAMFSEINGRLSNLVLNNVQINKTARNIALVAGTNNGSIKNVTVTGSYNISKDADESYIFGGIAATNTGTIEIATATINIASKRAYYIGGIAGKNSGIVSDVTFNGDITSDDGYYTGGIVGDNSSSIKYATSNSNSAIKITGRNMTYVGGIAGKSTGSIIASKVVSSNYSTLSAQYVGGIAGKLEGGTINACSVASNTKLSGNKVAGIASNISAGKVANCELRSTLDGSEQSAGMANVFSNNSEVTKCYFATPFADSCNKDGRKYESNTNFRQESGKATVSDNCLSTKEMTKPSKQDSMRNYGTDYYARHVGGGIGSLFNTELKEYNLPNDNLCDEDERNGTGWFGEHGWNTAASGYWNYGSGGPVLKSIDELKAKNL